jgi:hypothetical protein
VQSEYRIKEDMQDVQDRGKKGKEVRMHTAMGSLSPSLHPANPAYPLPSSCFL